MWGVQGTSLCGVGLEIQGGPRLWGLTSSSPSSAFTPPGPLLESVPWESGGNTQEGWKRSQLLWDRRVLVPCHPLAWDLLARLTVPLRPSHPTH